MRPSTYTLLAEMPLTPAGKLDRVALAELKTAAPGEAEEPSEQAVDDGPRTATEELLIRICQEVLGVEGVAGRSARLAPPAGCASMS